MRFRKYGRRVRGVASALTLLVLSTFPHAARAVSAAKLGEGAIAAAAELFQKRETHGRATDLLRFGLALAPDNVKGLLMQAKLERKQHPVADPPPESVLRPFLLVVLRTAEGTESPPHKLLLYRVAELVDPENEIALVSLTKARNDGHNIDYDDLLREVTGTGPAEPNSTQPPGHHTENPNTGGEGVVHTPPQAPSMACCERVKQANPLRGIRRKRSAEDIEKDLGDLRIGAFPPEGTSGYELGWLNELNKRLISRGYVVVPYCDETFDLDAIRFTDTGIPVFEGHANRSAPLYTAHHRSQKLGHFLAGLCSGLELGYRYMDGAVLLVPADAGHNKACAGARDASAITHAFEKNPLQAQKTYRKKYVVIEGRVSSLRRGMDGTKLLLANDDMELNMATGVGTARDFNVGQHVKVVGMFSHNNLDRLVVTDCIPALGSPYAPYSGQ